MKVEDIRRVLIIGAGSMGQQIGFQCAIHGYDVALYDMADNIFTMEKLAEERIRSFQIEQGQQIRIHTSESFGAYYLPAIIHQFNPFFFI